MNMIKLSPEYYKAWNNYCYEHTWFWHSTHWIEYLQNSKFGVEFKDHSFFIEQNGQIVGIVPLLQEGDQLISPGFEDKRETLAEVKRIALENGVQRVHVDAEIKSYLDVSKYTCMLDLANVRPSKGHRAAIKKGEKYLTYREAIDIWKFREDYFEIAGQVTRPKKTFELLGEWINLGYGILLEALFEGQTAGYIYILAWKEKAYYFMSAVFPQFKQYNVSHYLQSVAFEMLRQRGIRFYELGEQVYSSLHSQPSDKESNISLFKRGFGGQIIRSPASECFFDEQYFRQVCADRIEQYVRSEFT